MKLSAIILAGGESRRMGRDKAWMPLGGEPLIARALEIARAAGAGELFVSGRPEVDYSSLPAKVLTDLQPGLGPLSGIERGLDAATSPLLLVLAVDLPHMTSEFLRGLLASCDQLIGAVPELDGRLEPLAAIYPKRCYDKVASSLRQSRYSAREFAGACLCEGFVRRFPVAASDASCFKNWNAPADIPETM